MLQNAAPIHYPDFMFQYREAANFPWRSQAAWLYSQMTRWDRTPFSAVEAETAQDVFRPDIYREALAGSAATLPSSSSRLEGAVTDALGVGAAQGRLILGKDTFFDRRAFDPEDIPGYLADGALIPADLVVIAVGIRPSVALARDAGIAIGRGIHVDDHMVTSDPAVLAVGECVEHDGQVYGLVAPLWEMCRALADGLVETPTGYTGSVTSTKLKVSGIDMFSAGDLSGGDGAEDIVLRDASRGIYKRVVVRDDRIVGAVLYGDTADGGWYSTCSSAARTFPSCATF